MDELRVALYARVSMEENEEGNRRYQEPENQLEPLRAWAKSQGWEVYKEYLDRGSGADPSRQGFRNMMNEGMQQKFKAVLIWRLDRFSREGISSMLGYIEKLKSRGVAVKSLSESWVDTSADNPIGEILLAVFAWVAKEERRKISERTKAGIQRRRNIGQWKGGRPKGSKDKKPRKRTITHERALIKGRVKADALELQ